MVGGWAIAAAVGIALLPTVQERLVNEGFLVDDSPSAELRAVLERDFPEQAAPLTAAIPAGREARAATRRVARAFAGVAAIRAAKVVAPGSARQPGVVTLLTRTADGKLTEQVEGLRARAERAARPSAVYIGGVNAYFADVTEETRDDLAHAERIGVPITLLVLVAAFGSFAAAAIPLAVGVAGLAVAFGLLLALTAFLDVQIFVLNLAALVGLGVGVDYALLIVSRIRSELAAGADPVEACSVAGAHAGHAVLVSGCAVVLALCGIFTIGIPPYYGMALGTILAVTAMVLAALTLLPAVAALSARFLHPRPRATRRRTQLVDRLSRLTVVHPVPLAVIACFVLVVMATPLGGIRFALPGPDLLPERSGARKAAELAAHALGPGGSSPVLVAIDRRRVSDARARGFLLAAERVLPEARTQSFFDRPELLSRDGRRGLAEIRPGGSAEGRRAQATVRELRRIAPAGVSVGGLPGERFDEVRRYEQRLPLAVAFVLLSTMIVLALAFRSLVIPIKAVFATLLSVGAALGAAIWVFQDGHLVDLFGFQQVDGIPAFLPIFLFPIVFGLSTDYEIFLLSRIAEARRAGLDDRAAIQLGLTATARTITGAAAVMVSVALAFAATDLIPTQATGFGISVAVVLDATIVRLLLVPALLALLGPRAWWWPRRRNA